MRRHGGWLGWATVMVVFAVLALVTWRKWPDILIDSGVQLYIPWRLSHGAVLYRELFYIGGGPLSQYFNALLFELFGASMRTLVITNLTLVALMVGWVYRRFLAVADAWTATLIGLVIVCGFAFSHYEVVDNSNYALPYSHEALHGLLLSIFTVFLLSDWVRQARHGLAVLAGLGEGLVFLTKPDIFLALTFCAAAAFILFCATRKDLRFAATSLTAFLLASLVPALVFFVGFLSVENWHTSLRSVAFAWIAVFQSPPIDNPYYQWNLGLDRPFLHLFQTGIQFFVLGSLTVLYAAVLRRPSFLKSKWTMREWARLGAWMAPLLVLAGWYDWLGCGASLPLLSLTSCGLLAWQLKGQPPRAEAVFPLLWNVLGLGLLVKLGIHPRIWFYGVFLAMPAMVGAVYLLFHLLPRWLDEQYQVRPQAVRFIVGTVTLIACSRLFGLSECRYASKTLAVGQGANAIITVANERGKDIRAALAWIDQHVPPGATVAAVPTGVMLNFLSRRVNSTPCLFWDPYVVSVLGNAKMTRAFERHPPDYVLIVERPNREFGVGYFGQTRGYGMQLMQWVHQHYARVALIGHEPLRNGLFGIEILQRRRATSEGISTNQNTAP